MDTAYLTALDDFVLIEADDSLRSCSGRRDELAGINCETGAASGVRT